MARRKTKEFTEAELDEMLVAAGRASEVKAVPVEVVYSDPQELTTAEKKKRKQLEKTVEKAFYLAGLALKELRDLRLYRETHRSFDDYCRERFGHSRQKANFLIVAADIYRHLTTNGCQILPANERQIRPLCLLPPDQQTEAWTTAVEEANPKIPSGRLVRSVVNQIRELHPVSNPYKVGDVCEIRVKENPDLKGKHKCWGIVRSIGARACTVACWDGDLEVKIEHLKPKEYTKAQRKTLGELVKRLEKFDGYEVEPAAYSILENFGKLPRLDLTPLEDKLLSLLEQEYQIIIER
ncbi:hypothetical protein HC931_19745 [Candidatus Gracilibacteria bacterium]|nr:hypothetical protein [Candidatus Gracilibacteria bacterium]NJM86131.1 hypothetical protein [Hydrococcus sp. RU_2_2]NJP20463.1 hypothetical protein [Hydrococcus sp. CRU_1_1]